MPDANLIIGVTYDDKGRQALIASNERAFKQSSQSIAANEQQARRGSAFSGGQNAAYRTGMISQQAQDVAVSLQMGMSASRVVAQQGSQIASIFGPKGMVIGGVIAIGAAIAEWAFKTKEAEKAAEEYAESMKRAEGYKTNAREASQNIAIERARAISGSNVADAMKQEAELREKNLKLIIQAREITKQRDNLKPTDLPEGRGMSFREIMSFDETKRQKQEDFNRKNTAFNIELQKIQAEIDKNKELEKIKAAARTKTIAAQESMFAMEKRIQANLLDFSASHTDREIEDEKRILAFKLTSRNIANEASLTFEQKAARMESERILFGAESREVARKRKEQDEKTAMELRRKDWAEMESKIAESAKNTAENNDSYNHRLQSGAEKLLEIKKEIKELENQGGLNVLDEAERAEKISKLKMDQFSAEKRANDELLDKTSQMSAITMRADATRLDVLKAEKELLDKKIAFTPNEIALLNAKKRQLDEDIRKQQVEGLIAAGGAGMGIVAQQRAADRAEEKARKRAEGNLGLGNIRRGLGGEIIGGVNLDPNSGKVGERVGPEEIARRQKLLGVMNERRNLPIPAEAVFSPQQIKELGDAISLAVLALQTK